MVHSPKSLSHRPRLITAMVGAVVLSVVGLTACSTASTPSAACKDGKTEITLSGPNQWTSSGSTFGPAWEALVASFEKQEPCVTLKTNVLPLDSFYQTISTQLAAGSATDLVFGAATHDPYMIYSLTDALKKPNPYIEGNKAWLDAFNPDYFTVDKVANSKGNVEAIPFNLVGVALFYNKTAFKKAGIDKAPVDFETLIKDCDALKQAGFTPEAMDNGSLGTGWTIGALTAQFLGGHLADKWNVYNSAGDSGTADPLSAKSIARALATGELRADLPEVQAALTQTKRLFDHCVSADWSGTASTSASIVGAQQFKSGKAAMAFGVNFGVAELDGVDFEVGSMPFPTISKETSPLVTGDPARFGTGLGGTSYMIPSTIKGKNLEYAIKFLQFVSAPKHIEPWLATSGGIPVLAGVKPPANVAGFLDGDWAKPFKVGYGILQTPSTTTNNNAFGGYLLGSKTLAQQTTALQALYDQRVLEDVRNHPEWASAHWKKG